MESGKSPSQTGVTSSWRSSTALVIFTATLGLFTETFLYGFIVPVVPYMFETRLKQNPAYTQRYASGLLFVMGLMSTICAPIVGHFADKLPGRKAPLLISLPGCTLGSVLIASTISVWAVFLGRVIQGISGSGAWIVTFAMLTDSIDRKHHGKTLGLASSFITGGILSGPAIAGTFLQWLGYWSAWAVPFALLAIDLVARFLMVDSPKSAIPTVSREADEAVHAEAIETTALLVNEDASTQQNNTGPIADSQLQTRGFYRVMLTQPAFLAGLLNVVAWSLVLSSFDATFPLHLRRVFNWGPAPIGLLFLGLQVPGIFLAPIAGWFRDRVGLRWPTTVGWLLLAPLFCLVGLPGSSIIPGLESGPRAEGVFVATIVCIGVVATLGRGAGTIQMTFTLRELQEREPGVFGPHGGSSRLFAVAEVGFNTGLMIGPVLGGVLSETGGFHWFSFFLAMFALVVSAITARFFTSSARPKPEQT